MAKEPIPEKLLRCSQCGRDMDTIRVSGYHYSNVEVYACGQCGGLWFDKGKLYSLSHTGDLIEQLEGYIKISDGKERPETEQICPRCQVPLEKAKNHLIPENIEMYRCRSCGGNFVSGADLQRYVEFRIAK